MKSKYFKKFDEVFNIDNQNKVLEGRERDEKLSKEQFDENPGWYSGVYLYSEITEKLPKYREFEAISNPILNMNGILDIFKIKEELSNAYNMINQSEKIIVSILIKVLKKSDVVRVKNYIFENLNDMITKNASSFATFIQNSINDYSNFEKRYVGKSYYDLEKLK